MPHRLVLDPLPACGELVDGQVDDMERVHDLPGLGQVLGRRFRVAGEPVHGHDPDPVAERAAAGIEPVAEGVGGPAGHHVQESGRAYPVDQRGQVHDDGDEPRGPVAP